MACPRGHHRAPVCRRPRRDEAGREACHPLSASFIRHPWFARCVPEHGGSGLPPREGPLWRRSRDQTLSVCEDSRPLESVRDCHGTDTREANSETLRPHRILGSWPRFARMTLYYPRGPPVSASEVLGGEARAVSLIGGAHPDQVPSGPSRSCFASKDFKNQS